MNKRMRKKQQNYISENNVTKESSIRTKLSKFNKKWILVIVNVVVLVGVIVFVKTSYAYLYQTLRGQKSYSLKVKGFSLKLDDSSTSENIKIENSIPVSDEEGKKSDAYTFSIINEDPSETGYVLYLDDVEIDNEINRMKDTVVKYQLIENGKEQVGLVSDLGTHPFRILTSGVMNGNETNTYSLRFWIKEDAEIPAGQIFNVKIRVIATSKEAILEGKLVFGDTIVTSDSGITSMTSDELQTYVDRSLSRVLLDRYPVGSVYISTTDQNPTEVFGGEWIRFGKGKNLVGVDEEIDSFSTVEKTGGNKDGEVTLTEEELPSHQHLFTPIGNISSVFKGEEVTTNTNGTHTHRVFTYFDGGNYGYNVPAGSHYLSNSSIHWTENGKTNQNAIHAEVTPTGEHSHTVTATGSVVSTFSGVKSSTEASGNGQAFSTQDPYITVYMWKRIS